MWTKIKERENPNPKHKDAQRGTTKKKKRESKPQKPWGDQENMDQEKLEKEESKP